MGRIAKTVSLTLVANANMRATSYWKLARLQAYPSMQYWQVYQEKSQGTHQTYVVRYLHSEQVLDISGPGAIYGVIPKELAPREVIFL